MVPLTGHFSNPFFENVDELLALRDSLEEEGLMAKLSGADHTGAILEGAKLYGAKLTCIIGRPSLIPSGYICESDPDCSEPNRFRIVQE